MYRDFTDLRTWFTSVESLRESFSMATQLAEEGDFDLLSTIYDIIKRYFYSTDRSALELTSEFCNLAVK